MDVSHIQVQEYGRNLNIEKLFIDFSIFPLLGEKLRGKN